jgi:putative two-component system response regulator
LGAAHLLVVLISVRPYKPAYSIGDSLKIMDAQDGSHFDPSLMAAFPKTLPQILEVVEEYADEKGALTDFGLATDLLPGI